MFFLVGSAKVNTRSVTEHEELFEWVLVVVKLNMRLCFVYLSTYRRNGCSILKKNTVFLIQELSNKQFALASLP